MKSLLTLLFLLSLQACQSASYLRIRSQEVTKDYQLLYLKDSNLLVQDWDANRNATWRTLAEIPLHSIDTIWQLNVGQQGNVVAGAVVGLLTTYAILNLVPALATAIAFSGGVGLLIIGVPALGIGALIGSAFPSDDRVHLPHDPEIVAFLRECQYYDSYDDMPPILQEKILRLASER
jgi:hypothetical protein